VATARHPTGGGGAWKTETVGTSIPTDCGKDGPGEDCVANLTGVSCASASLCVAGDSEGDAITSRDPADGPYAWKATQIDRNTSLESVSCRSSSLCVATDFPGNVLATRSPTGSTWKLEKIDAGRYGMAWVPASVSCGSPRLCVEVVGRGAAASTDPAGGAHTWSVENVDRTGYYGFSAVSCANARLCVAVDGSGNAIVGTTQNSPVVPIAPTVPRPSGQLVPRAAHILRISWTQPGRHPLLVTSAQKVLAVARTLNALPVEGPGICSEGLVEGPPTITFSFMSAPHGRVLATAHEAARQTFTNAWCIPITFSAREHRTIRLEAAGYFLKQAATILRLKLGL
jgi:hypothetical protein